MSVEYDDKIVRMQFDNKGFESGVSTTLRTLEDLKSALKFDNIATGLDNISTSIKGLSFDSLANGVEGMIVKIPVMGTVMDQTIRNMTNSAEAFLKDTLGKFSNIGNAKTGFGEYEQQVGAIKTIQASTGESIEHINEKLDELNKYADDTIYSFTDMTSNIGKFTNAGVKLDDSVAAIQGVANVAAVSGANTQEASRAMYNFAQALSAGSVKLIDWKSIENANMATVEFKNELIKTALELGTIRKEGNKYVTTTTDLSGKVSEAFDATKNFNDSLSHQWMTTDVLVKTLGRYTDTTTEIGKKATEAATKVNTFHQAMDAIVEDLGSNWTESWRYIVGDFNEATEMWSKFKDAVSSIFKPAAEARNEMLKFWSTNRGGAEAAAEAAEKNEERQKELFDIAKRGWNLEFGVGVERRKQLEAMGYSYEEVQSIINGICDGSVKSWEDVKLAVDGATDAVNKNANTMTGREMVLKGISNLWESFRSILWAVRTAWKEVFPPMTGEKLVELSKSFMEFTERIKMSGKTMNELRRTLRGLFSLLDIGMTLIKAVVKGITTMISTMLSAFGKSDKSILTFTAEIGDIIYKIDQLIKESGIFEAIFVGIGKIVGTVGGAIITIVKTVIDVLSTLFKTLFGFEGTGIDFSDLTGSFKDASTSISEYTTNIAEKIASFAVIPVTGIQTFAGKVKGAFVGFEESTGFFSKTVDVFQAAWEKIKMVIQVIGAILTPVVNLIKDKLGDLMGGTMSFDDFLKYLKEGGGLIIIGQIIVILKQLKKIFRNIMPITDSMSYMFEQLGDSAKAMQQKIKSKSLRDIAIAIGILIASVWVLSKFDEKDLIKGLGALSVLMYELNAMIKKLNPADLWATSKAIKAIGIAILLMTLSVKMLGSMSMDAAIQGLGLIGIMLFELQKFLKGVSKLQGSLSGIAGVLISLALTINLLVLPIVILGLIPAGIIARGLGFLTWLLADLVIAIDGMMLVGNKGGSLDKVARVLFILGIVVNMLIIPILILGLVPTDIISKGLGFLTWIIADVVIAIGAFEVLSGKSKELAAVAKVIFMFTICVAALGLLVNIFGNMELPILIQGMAALTILIALMTVSIWTIVTAFKGLDSKELNEITKILLIMIAMIGIMSLLMYSMSQMSGEEIKNGAIGIAAVVGGVLLLVGGLTLLSKAMSSPQMTAGANNIAKVFLAIGTSILMVGAGIYLLIEAFDKLNNIEFGPEFLDKMSFVGASLLIIIESMIGGIIAAIVMAIPIIVNGFLSVVDLILAGLDDNIGNILEHISNIIHAIGDFVLTETPYIVETIMTMITQIFDTIADNSEQISDWAYDLCVIIAAIIDGIAEGIGLIIDAIINLVQSVADKLYERRAEIASSIWDMLKAVVSIIWTFLYNNVIYKAGVLGKKFIAALVSFIIEGVNSVIKFIVGAVEEFINDIIDGVNKLLPDKFEISNVSFDAPQFDMPGWVTEWQALAKGGRVNSGGAIVGEAGPELLSQRFGRTDVIPLSNQNAKNGTKTVFDNYIESLHSQFDNLSRYLSSKPDTNAYDDTDIIDKVDRLTDSINGMRDDFQNTAIVMDTGAVVGQIARPLDKKFGKINNTANRSVGKVKVRR